MEKNKGPFRLDGLLNFVKRNARLVIGVLTVILALLILVVVVGGNRDTTPEPSQTGTTAANTTATQTTTTTTTTAPADPTVPTTTVEQIPLLYTHPLTGVALAEPMLDRPIAVMLNNAKGAMPQHGVSQADIVYETLAEGGVTRCMGIFTNVAQVEKIGAIRSARLYFVQLSQAYDAAYVHAGGSPEADAYLKNLKGMDLHAGLSATHFYRDQDRLNSGYALEHTLFTSGTLLLDYAQVRKVPTIVEQEQDYGMHFDEEAVLAGTKAEKVKVYFHTWDKPTALTKTTELTYNAQDGLYYAAQHGGDYVDGNGGNAAFRNVVILRTHVEIQEDQNHLTIVNVGSGTGHFIRDGEMVPIRWSRTSATEPFHFTLENGEEVPFGVGSTYIAIIPNHGQVDFE